MALAIPRKELLQFLESMLHSVKKVQLTLDHCGVFHQILNSVKALVGEGKGHKQSNTRNYQQAFSFHDALYTYGKELRLLMGPAAGIGSHESPAKPNSMPHQ